VGYRQPRCITHESLRLSWRAAGAGNQNNDETETRVLQHEMMVTEDTVSRYSERHAAGCCSTRVTVSPSFWLPAPAARQLRAAAATATLN